MSDNPLTNSPPPPPPPDGHLQNEPTGAPPPPPFEENVQDVQKISELPQSPPADNAKVASGTGLEPNIAAGLAELFPLIGGIVFLLLEKSDRFVRFHAMQSLIFGAAWFLVGFVSSILLAVIGAVPFLGGFVAGLLSLILSLAYLGALVIWIIAVVKAFQGKEWEIPFIAKFAREQLAKTEGVPR